MVIHAPVSKETDFGKYWQPEESQSSCQELQKFTFLETRVMKLRVETRRRNELMG